MNDNHVYSKKKRGFHTPNFNKWVLGAMRWSLLSLGVASIFLSLSLIVRAASSWAQCGADSYVECSGGVRCTETDQVGCACYDSGGRVVSKHSCREAAPDESYAMIEESAY
jgi:hypothetical protein